MPYRWRIRSRHRILPPRARRRPNSRDSRTVSPVFDFLRPELPRGLRRVAMPVVDASDLYIHPNVWHEGVFATRGTQRFFDKQGAVHARVSVDFAREFGCLIEAALT